MDLPGAAPDLPWEVSDDEAGSPDPQTARVVRIRQAQEQRIGNGRGSLVIDLTNDDEDEALAAAAAYEDELERELENESGSGSSSSGGSGGASSSPSSVRNGPLPAGARFVDSWTTTHGGGMDIRAGVLVRLVRRLRRDEHLSARYVKVVTIYAVPGSEGSMRGIPLVRASSLGGILAPHKREMVEVWDVDNDDPRGPLEQCLVEFPTSMVAGIWSSIIYTRAPYPAFNEPGYKVCRWKFVRHWPSTRFRERGGNTYRLGSESAISSISDSEVNHDAFRIANDTLRADFRGGLIARGGEFRSTIGVSRNMPIEIEPDLTPTPTPTPTPREELARNRGQKYTFFDAFSGAGGSSSGAKQAGLKNKYAIDLWAPACNTYRANFPRAQMLEEDIFNFIVANTATRADICHLSPPCQYFSPAKTVANERNDSANLAALYACGGILDNVKPRIFTLEQTFGIVFHRHADHLHALIEAFTCRGYSVRWSVIKLADWGVPATRKRLIMIGAAPGERLPEFPPSSHSDCATAPGTSPYVTVNDALRSIPRGAMDHNPRLAQIYSVPKEKWDPHHILKRCITTSGGNNYHFNGRRAFTMRELATLQGFPVTHKFVAPAIKKQIGNAFPPIAARHLFRHIEKCLLKEDRMGSPSPGAAPRHRERSRVVIPQQNIVVLDSTDHVDPATSVRSSFSEPEYGDDADTAMLDATPPRALIDLTREEFEGMDLDDTFRIPTGGLPNQNVWHDSAPVIVLD